MLIAKANGWREQVSMWQDKEPKCPASSPLSITTPQLVKFKPQPFTAVDLNSAPE
jgi:hypothetical protein